MNDGTFMSETETLPDLVFSKENLSDLLKEHANIYQRTKVLMKFLIQRCQLFEFQLFAKCDPEQQTSQNGFNFLVLNFKTCMDEYNALAKKLNILGLMQLPMEKLDYAWKHTDKTLTKRIKFGADNCKMTFIPAVVPEEGEKGPVKYYVLDNRTQCFLDITKDPAELSMKPPEEPITIKEVNKIKTLKFSLKEVEKQRRDMAKESMQKVKDQCKKITRKPRNCRGEHGLKEFITPSNGYDCDICKHIFPAGTKMWGCRQCNWDVCAKEGCYNVTKADCPQKHGLQEGLCPYNGRCDICRDSIPKGAKIQRCAICKYDACDKCTILDS